MGEYSKLNGKKIKIWKTDNLEISEFMEQYPEFKNHISIFNNITGGTIIHLNQKEGLYVKAKNSVLLIKEVQAENSKKMPVQDFLRGNKVELGEAFE